MKLREELAEDTTVRLLPEPGNERFVVTRKNGELISKKLVTYHLNSDGSETKFDMRQESDGSQRVIDLFPAFLELSAAQSKKVYVIDEVDRSLHTLLIRRLLEGYLAKCSHNSRSQLLFTTHNVLLMDQDLLRRDEMWIAERNAEGISSLLSCQSKTQMLLVNMSISLRRIGTYAYVFYQLLITLLEVFEKYAAFLALVASFNRRL